MHVRFVCFHLRRFITLSQPKPLSASPGKGTLQSVLVLCSRCCNLYGISYSSIDHHITDPLFATSSTIGRDMVKAGQAARAGARPWVTAFESRGLKPGQARAKPFQWLWLGPRVEKAKAPSGQAKAGASRPSRAGTALVVAAFSQRVRHVWRQRVVGGCRARPGPRSTASSMDGFLSRSGAAAL